MDTTRIRVADILAQRLAVLSAQDVESRKRTQEALANVRAMLAELEETETEY